MSGPSDYQPSHPALKWIERRLPIMGLVHSSFIAYPTPRNLNYWWTFGAILSLMLGVQILTGSSWRCTTPRMRTSPSSRSKPSCAT
jgi:ubiquinol-cytochrome c reductase cytochrome b/c1 subunit